MQHQEETVGAIATKVAPPVGVSLATVYGYQVSELVLWATLEILSRSRPVRRRLQKEAGRDQRVSQAG